MPSSVFILGSVPVEMPIPRTLPAQSSCLGAHEEVKPSTHADCAPEPSSQGNHASPLTSPSPQAFQGQDRVPSYVHDPKYPS